MNTIDNCSLNVQFKGYSFLKKNNNQKIETCYYLASLLSQNSKDIIELTKKSSNRKFSFFSQLAEKYNAVNHYNIAAEDSSFINKIFETVKKPTKNHFALAEKYKGSFQDLLRIFVATNNNSNNMGFANKINKEIILAERNAYSGLLPDLLESEHSNEYIKNYDKYKSYLKLNCTKENAVKNLDKMIEEKSYNQEIFDKQYRELTYKNLFPYTETENFNSNIFAENYTQPRYEIIQSLYSSYNICDAIINSGGDKELAEIYLSTTEDNIQLRDKLIQMILQNKNNQDIQESKENISELNKLFQTIDSDKHVKNFFDNIDCTALSYYSIKDINSILDNVSTLKLDIFKENANSILSQYENCSVIEVLNKEIENPFYETDAVRKWKKTKIQYGFMKPESIFSKTLKKFKNRINIIKYSIKKHNEPQPTIIQIQFQNPIAKATNIPSVKEENILDKPIKIIPNKNENTKNSVFEIASKKLGRKMFAKQQDAFGQNATKIRLSLLPEIFASIKDTRATDRNVGKQRSYSSNKDALELYLLINGNNKKFVNYLLKKRNTDKTRMFEVKEIINMLKKANSKIELTKKTNPNYRARDTRRYFNHLYEAKLQQYGKA